MKKNKIILSALIGFSSATIITGVALGAIYASKSSSNNSFVNLDSNSPVMFDNKQFANSAQAYEYALSLVNSEQFNVSNQKLYSLTSNNATHVFNSALDLNNWISSQITTIENAASNDMFHNLNEDKSIPINEMHKYNINTATDSTFDNNTTTIYKRADGSYFAGGDDALNKAKQSYLQIHKGYYFNGIYFKTKQDLEIYLNKIYSQQIIDGTSAASNGLEVTTDNYNKVVINDINGNRVAVSDSIYMKDEKNAKNEIRNFLYANAYQYLKIKGQNGSEDTYLKYNRKTGEIEGNLSENISMKDLPVLKKVSTDNKSLYVVDANVNEKYNLYGPYFLKTDGNVTNITNPDLWEKSDDSPEQILRSQSISILAGLFDLLLMDPSTKNQFSTDSSGNISRSWDGDSPLFYISTSKDSNLYDKERKMLNAIKNVQTDDRGKSLYYDFVNMYNNLINTKNYSTVYAIPTIYNFLIDNLITYNANVDTVIKVKEYFDELCNIIQNIFESLFGDLLLSYNGQTRFNFAQYFQINQYGNDGSNLNGILNGYDLIKNYKGLVAACYVLTKAIGNSQSSLQVNEYKVANDDYLLSILADGVNSDQITANAIKSKWNIKNSNGYSVFDQLQAIYDSYSNWGTLTNNYVADILNNLNIDPNMDSINKIDMIYNSLVPQHVIDGVNSMNDSICDELDKLNKIIDSNNSNKFQIEFKQLMTNQFKFVATNNINFKLESLSNSKLFLSGNQNCGWIQNGLLKDSSYLLQNKYKNKIEASLESNSYYEFIQNSETTEVISKAKPKNYVEIAQVIANSALNIASVGMQMANDLNNPYFSEVSDQIIAAGVMNICSSICDIAAQFSPPPVNVIIQAVGFAFSFISAAIGTAEKVIYEYKVNDSSNTKYYWDGGLVMKRFWGIWNDEKRNIHDLQMQSPIELVTSSNKDVIYFNEKTYEVDDDSILRKEAMKYILDNDLIGSDNVNAGKYTWVYSVEPNPNKLNSDNALDSCDDLAGSILNVNKQNLIGVGDELFINGYKFSGIQDFQDNMKTLILDKIQPVYIAKLPDLDENGYPIDKQRSFHMPFPYYEPFSESNQDLICGYNEGSNNFITASAMDWRAVEKSSTKTDENQININNIPVVQNQDYITYNSNKSDENASTYSMSINEIYNYITNRFLDSFNVESKTVLKSNLYNSNVTNFDDFNTSVYSLNIYLVELTPGVKKYFINRNDAIEYILKTTTNDGSVLLNMYNKDILNYVDSNGEKLYFNNQDQFNKWFVNSLSKIN